MKRFGLFVCLSFLQMSVVFAQQEYEYEYEGWYYTINDDTTLTITGYKDSSVIDLDIPSNINGFKVTAVEQFKHGHTSDYSIYLRSISIPEGVTTLSRYAFFNCERLEVISLPKTLQKIGEVAFKGCTRLTSINIPEGIKTIKKETFRNCTNLTHVYLPNSIKKIEQGAFYGCSKLARITLPKDLESIERDTFRDCTALEMIDIPSSAKIIKDGAFAGCANLLHVILHEGIKEIQGADLPLPKMNAKGLWNIGKALVDKDNSFTDVIATHKTKDLVQEDDLYVAPFKGCNRLTSIKLPSSIVQIGADSLKNAVAVFPEAMAEVIFLGLPPITISPQAFSNLGRVVYTNYPKDWEAFHKVCFKTRMLNPVAQWEYRPSEEEKPDNNQLHDEYDEEGRIQERNIYNDSGTKLQHIEYTYDGKDMNEYTVYSYDDKGRINKYTIFKKSWNTWTEKEYCYLYDAQGNKTGYGAYTVNEEGRCLNEYDLNGNEIAVVTYDEKGRRTKREDKSDSSYTVYVYNSDGTQIEQVFKLTWLDGYGWGRAREHRLYSTVTRNANGECIYEYYDNGDKKEIIEFNAEGVKTKETQYFDALLFNDAGEIQKYVAYNAEGKEIMRREYSSPDVLSLQMEYDDNGKLLKDTEYFTDGTIQKHIEYNANGEEIKRIEYSSPDVLAHLMDYDDKGTLLKEEVYNYKKAGDKYVFFYSTNGRKSKEERYQAQSMEMTSYKGTTVRKARDFYLKEDVAYDDNEKPIKSSMYDRSGDVISRKEYKENGNWVEQTFNPSGKIIAETQFDHEKDELTTTRFDNSGKKRMEDTYSYMPRGDMRVKVFKKRTFFYDNGNVKTEETYSPSQISLSIYNHYGRPLSDEQKRSTLIERIEYYENGKTKDIRRFDKRGEEVEHIEYYENGEEKIFFLWDLIRGAMP